MTDAALSDASRAGPPADDQPVDGPRVRRAGLAAGPGVRVTIRGLLFATGGLVLLYFLSTVFRTHPSTISLYDGWVGNLAYFGCALVTGLRAALVRDKQRAGWAAMAVALTLFALGNFSWTTFVQFKDPVPYPSIQDAFFLLFYPVAYLGVGLLVRDTLPGRGSRAIWLDGIIAALGVAALESAIVIAAITRDNVGDLGDVATNFAYPIGDLVLVTMLVAVFAVQGWRPDGLWWTLGAGLALFAVADSVYSLQTLAETYVTGSVLDSLWMIGTFLMAVAAWQTRATPASRESDGPSRY